LFKIKTQLANNSGGRGGDERYITKVDERMHSEEVKIVDMVREHLQIKEKTIMEGEW
jgi:hypothetical protein